MGKAKETWTWLLDMEGAGPADSPGLRTLRTLDDILAAHYPGKLGKVLIVNASGMRSSRRLLLCVRTLSEPIFVFAVILLARERPAASTELLSTATPVV